MSIDKAAARLQAWENGENLYHGTDEWTTPENDRAALAREYLRLTDPAPITEEWLREIGWRWSDSYERWTDSGSSGPVLVYYPSVPLLRIGASDTDITTRGQLRSLCRVLGINLNEKGTA